MGLRGVQCFGNGSRKLVKINGSFISAKYIHLLQNYLMPDLDEGKISPHDKFPFHRTECGCIQRLAISEPLKINWIYREAKVRRISAMKKSCSSATQNGILYSGRWWPICMNPFPGALKQLFKLRKVTWNLL